MMIRALREFFAKVFQPSTNYDIRFLATTATMPQDYIPILSSLTTISFPPNSINRLRYFKEQVMCGAGDFVKVGLSTAA